jgi:hypothetical protein
MTPEVARDREFSRRFLPHLKQIVGEHVIREAPMEEDLDRNTDLIVLELNGIRVACRVRRPVYEDLYPDEFTIRTARPSRARTELTKIVEGWGTHLLYGFGDEAEPRLRRWVLGDLHDFRLWFGRYLARHAGQLPGWERPNADGTLFRAFRYRDLPPTFVRASWPADPCRWRPCRPESPNQIRLTFHGPSPDG